MQDPIIKLAIVDDHPVVREGIKSLLQEHPEILVIGACANAAEAISFLESQQADVILLDINLPDISGIDLCKQLKTRYPELRILAISNYNERSLITQMLQNGATGYVLKNASAQELVTAVKTVASKRLYFAPEVEESLNDTSGPDFRELPKLTRREQEILKLIAEGLTTGIIADQLFISPLTVETHRRNLMQKFNANNAAALIRVASQYKLI